MLVCYWYGWIIFSFVFSSVVLGLACHGKNLARGVYIFRKMSRNCQETLSLIFNCSDTCEWQWSRPTGSNNLLTMKNADGDSLKLNVLSGLKLLDLFGSNVWNCHGKMSKAQNQPTHKCPVDILHGSLKIHDYISSNSNLQIIYVETQNMTILNMDVIPKKLYKQYWGLT